MFCFLRWEVLSLSDDRAHLLVTGTGLGLEVLITSATLARLTVGSTAEVFVHHHIAEWAQVLYGFHSESEKALFRQLLRVDGIGGRSALSVLSSLWVEGTLSAIASGDQSMLTSVSGIGKKTAAKIIVELKWSLSQEALQSLSTTKKTVKKTAAYSDVVESLAAMGYDRKRLESLSQELQWGLSTEEATLFLVKGSTKR